MTQLRRAALLWMTIATLACGGGGGDEIDGSVVSDGGIVADAAPECIGAGDCEDGFTCTGGICCAIENACGALCCGGADVCSFGKCVTPGANCLDTTECPANQYCEYALGDDSDAGVPPTCTSGVVPPSGQCLPKPPECAMDQIPGDPPSCLVNCEYHPPIADFSPVVKYSWGSLTTPGTADSVMMAPIVVQLDDDSCDGIVNERDIPEIVFATFVGSQYNDNGTLHAISIVDGVVVEKWTVNAGLTSPIHPGRSIAGGNFDGQPGNEIAVCTTDGRVRAYDASGNELWLSENAGTCVMPSIADLDRDGKVEIITESQVIDGATGTTKFVLSPTFANVVAMDVTGDGRLDLVGPNRVVDATGTELANTGLTGRYVAVGDLDKDGNPEIVVADNAVHTLHIWHFKAGATGNFEILREGIDINGTLSPSLCPAGSAGNTRGGGPPTIADFNGDGTPDVALAGGIGYAVFDGTKLMNTTVPGPDTFLWIRQTQDCSSASTGSSVFDFNGDGAAEVVYGDETTLHIYAGVDGTELFNTCNTNGTLFEYPLIADVDNDGQADIVVGSNNYSGFVCPPGGPTKTTGIRIFGAENGDWVRTRRVWNQHAYHVTNVEESGEIPTAELPNHLQPRLNNFRQNVQPQGEFSAPDLIATVGAVCSPSYALVARVRNLGEAAAPAGVPVAFYLGDPDNGGTELPGSPVATTRPLYPAEAEDVVLPVATPPPSGSEVYVIVDPTPMHPWRECRADNNKSAAGSASCGIGGYVTPGLTGYLGNRGSARIR